MVYRTYWGTNPMGIRDGDYHRTIGQERVAEAIEKI